VDYQKKQYHTVKENEYLAHIAKRYLHNASLWTMIRDANPKSVSANGSVRAGVRLQIPQLESEDAQVKDQQAAAAGPRRIIVQSGDSLSVLAYKHLGSSRKWQQLLDANRDQLTKPEQLQAGMKLILPDIAKKNPSAVINVDHSRSGAPASPRRRSGEGANLYSVRSGDTLSSIASAKLGNANRWYKLYRANQGHIENPDVLETGLELVIP
jgi:nucleoid-associated protein YgaU